MGDFPQQQQGQAVPNGQASTSGDSASPQSTTPFQVDPKLLLQLTQQIQGNIGARRTLAPLSVRPSARMPSMAETLISGATAFIPILGQAIQAGVNKEKQSKIDDASAQAAILNGALERASMMANGDDKNTMEYWENSDEFKSILVNGPTAAKNRKNWAKVFGVDWMNPEKTQNTVHYQGLQKFMRLYPHAKLVEKLHGIMQQQGGVQDTGNQASQQQPQQPLQGNLNAQQADTMAQRLTGVQMPDPTKQEGFVRSLAYLTRTQNEIKEKYQISPTAEGGYVAIDKTNPKAGAIPIRTENGDPVKGAVKSYVGKPVLVDQIPVGVMRADGPHTPGSPNWTAQDAADLKTFNDAYVQHTAELDKRMTLYRQAYMDARLQSTMLNVVDTESGQMGMIPAINVMHAPFGKYTQTNSAMQAMNRGVIFQDINYAAGQVEQSLNALPDKAFDPQARAMLSYVMKAPDPQSAFQTFLQSGVAGKLDDSQMKYVTSLEVMNEVALMMRAGGMGQSSDMLRAAVAQMLPGAASPSKAWAQRQLQLFKGQLGRLQKAVPSVGNLNQPEGQDNFDKDMQEWLKSQTKPEQKKQ